MEEGDSLLVVIDEKTHIHRKYSVETLKQHLADAFQDKKKRLESISWKEVKKSDKQGLGARPVKAHQIKLSIPPSAHNFMEDEKYSFVRKGFKGFKYFDKGYCIVGLRVKSKFYIFWIDQKPYDIYDH